MTVREVVLSTMIHFINGGRHMEKNRSKGYD